MAGVPHSFSIWSWSTVASGTSVDLLSGSTKDLLKGAWHRDGKWHESRYIIALMVVLPIDLSSCSTPEYPVVTYKFVGSISIKRSVMDMFIDFNISFELLFISSSKWWWTKHNRKTNQPTWLRRFLSFRYFSIKIDKINRLIAEIDNHKNSTDRFPSIFDINR